MVPFPGSEANVNVPPCSLMILEEMDKPNPIPPASDLVVKKGSVIWERTSDGIPIPSSWTFTTMLQVFSLKEVDREIPLRISGRA